MPSFCKVDLENPAVIENWEGAAFNQDPESANEIHSDELAQQFGFEGGLVPGVTLSAYLLHPAVAAWGEAFLERGHAHIQIKAPLYDGRRFAVNVIESSAASYSAELLRDDNTQSALAAVSLPGEAPAGPARRGDALLAEYARAPDATPEVLRRLMQDGCAAMRMCWDMDTPMRTYLRDQASMPALHTGAAPLANMSFILGVSNWLAAANFTMNPWVHMETRSQNYRRIEYGTSFFAEMQITDLFERRGHRFFDAHVALFAEEDNACLTEIELRAIYQMRGTYS